MTPQGYGTQRPLALDEVAGGMAAVVLALLVFPLTVVIFSAAVTDILGALVPEPSPDEIVPEEEEETLPIVETRFVRLGAPPDPRRMPDRYVPTAATAVPTAPTTAEVPLDALPPDPVTGEPGIRPPDPVQALTPEQRAANARNALLDQLGDSAEATASLAEPRLRDGDAEGIAEGTEERGDADIYPGRLQAFFRRGFQVPSSLSDEEARGLRCRVRVFITEDAHVGDYSIAASSGNDAFDAAVRQRMAQAAGAALPPPPPEEAERYLGTTQNITFTTPRRN